MTETKKKTNWRSKFEKMANAVTMASDPFAKVVRSSSPSANFVYGNTWGLPRGFSQVVYGKPKSGKSLYTRMQIGQLHQEDPDAIAVVFDAEFRWSGQLTTAVAEAYGIDLDRLWVFATNNPMEIFDKIEKDLAALIQEGAPIQYIVIDSISGIMGRRSMNADSIEVMQIGDEALTIQVGLKRILKTIRTNQIALSLITQARAEMDMIEQKRGNKIKMNASFGLQHFAEYFILISQNESAEGRKDLMGKEFISEDMTDLMDKGEKTGHKIRIVMKDSSMGPKGRTGEFTLDYKKGIINPHEEILRLGINRNIIKTKGMWLNFNGNDYQGKGKMLQAMLDTPSLQQEILDQLMAADARGDFAEQDKVDEVENAEAIIT